MSPDAYSPCHHAHVDFAIVVFDDGMLHTPVTYSSSDGKAHAVHVPADPSVLYEPALNPGAYCPAGHVLVVNTVFVFVPHTVVTY